MGNANTGEQPEGSVQQVDIGSTVPAGSVEAVSETVVTRTEKTETRAETESRLRRDEAEQTHKQGEAEKESDHRRNTANAEAKHRRAAFWAIIAILMLAAIGATLVVAFSQNAENQALGRNALTTVIGALVGYLTGSLSSPIKKE